jgi:sugar phosphate permease
VRVFFAAWSMYASYYLCRVNLSLAQPFIRDDLHLTDQQMGWIATVLMVAYGVGQIINGLLGERVGPRRMATTGMLISALANVAFGLSFTVPALLACWAVNGYAQSTGAPMRIKVLANWFPPHDRGRMMGLLGTDGNVGNLLCWLLVGLWVLPMYGWRAAFFVPAGIFLMSALHFWWRVRNQPEDVGLPSIEAWEAMRAAQPGGATGAATQAAGGEEDGDSWRYILKQSLGNPRVWLVGLAYFGVDLIRYGFMIWAPTFMVDQGAHVAKATLNMVMMPLAALPGIIVSGWITDRIGGRRAPVIAIMLFVLAGLAWAYPRIPAGDVFLTMACMAAIGFFLYGPHLMMGATIAIDLGSRKASAAASGFIDALGYAGAAVAGFGTAYVKDAWGQGAAFWLWISGALFAGVLMLTLWNWKPPANRKYA